MVKTKKFNNSLKQLTECRKKKCLKSNNVKKCMKKQCSKHTKIFNNSIERGEYPDWMKIATK